MKQVLLSILVAIVSALVTAGYLTQDQGSFAEGIVTKVLVEKQVVTGSVVTGEVSTGNISTGVFLEEAFTGPVLDME